MVHFGVTRRTALNLASGGVAAVAVPRIVHSASAQSGDRLVISFPVDVPSWDAVAHTFPPAMSIYKAVFDSPLTLSADLRIVPNVVAGWRYTTDDHLNLEINLRNDVLWHNGDRLTADDFKFTFDDRPKDEHHMAIADVWNAALSNIDVLSPTQAVMRFSTPMPTAVPWLAFYSSYVIPRRYFQQVGGKRGFMRAPIGSGPYRLVEYQRNSRIVLEAFDRYWAGAPRIRRVVFEIARDPAARTAAIESRAADLAVELPIREAERLNRAPGLVGRLDPTTELILLEIPSAGPLQDRNVRLAAHHAIDKQEISRSLFFGRAIPLSMPATRGTPGDLPDYIFPHSEDRARSLLAQSGFGPQSPVRFNLLTTRGSFANDHEIAISIQRMWQRVGIEAELQVIEPAAYTDLVHRGQLPGPYLCSWANAAGDPEFYAGYLLHPDSRLAAWKSEDMRSRMLALFAEANEERRYEGYRQTGRYAVEQGYTIPLLQGVAALAHSRDLNFQPWQNGWVLPYFQSWS